MNDLELIITPDYSHVKENKLFLKLDIKIDGKNPLMTKNDNFDIYELFNSWHQPENNNTYFIFTCECGIAGCAGYFDGISLTKNGHYVHWNDLDQNNSYSFVKSRYAQKLRIAAKEVLDWKSFADNRNLQLHFHPDWNVSERIIELAAKLA